MTYEITEVGSTSILGVSFVDEGVELTEHIKIDGNEQAALNYLPFFEKDLRRNHSQLFPQPVQPEGGMTNEIR